MCVKVRRFPPERREERLEKAIKLALIYSKDPIIRWLSKDEGVVDLSKLTSPKVRTRWVDGELVAEIEEG